MERQQAVGGGRATGGGQRLEQPLHHAHRRAVLAREVQRQQAVGIGHLGGRRGVSGQQGVHHRRRGLALARVVQRQAAWLG